MNWKQLRQIVCGSAVVLVIGGSLLGQAAGAGGFMSRLWDGRPKLSQTPLNPRNWFSHEESAASTPEPEPVVSVRPELTQNPFDSSSPPVAVTENRTTSPAPSDSSQPRVSATTQQGRSTSRTPAERTSDKTTLPVITAGSARAKQATVEELPPPGIDAIFKRVSPDMLERARRRKSGASESDRQTASTESKEPIDPNSESVGRNMPRRSLLQMSVPDRQDSRKKIARPATDAAVGRVTLGDLSSQEATAAVKRGYVRLEETELPETPAAEPGSATRQDFSTGFDSTYERLLAQVKGEAGEAAAADFPSGSLEAPSIPVRASSTANADVARTDSAPRLPDSIDANPFLGIAAGAISDGAVTSQPTTAETTSRHERDLSIDEMIAQSRARMVSTPLAQQAQRERDSSANAATKSESRLAGFAETELSAAAIQQPLTVPQSFEAENFRTYGERSVPGPRMESDSQSLTVPTETLLGHKQFPGTHAQRGPREQGAHAATTSSTTPSVVPGRSGSGIVIESPRYSAVKPRVTSNAAPSISVPDNSGVRRLSYEQRAVASPGNTRIRLQSTDTAKPILMIPGETYPATARSDSGSLQENTPTRDQPSPQAVPAPPGSPIEWPNDADLAPVKPKSGGTSWGLIVFCLAILAAGCHITACRFRQSRTAGSACKS
ncbi:MAG: hypothetical protein ACYTGL_21445 [Planctomycetota bacterium]|jgi:hypothetical protein